MPGGYALSVTNNPALHTYQFAWEIAVVKNGKLRYDTPITSDIIVTSSDDEANEVIHRAYEILSNVKV
jgi:hypothetical protein